MNSEPTYSAKLLIKVPKLLGTDWSTQVRYLTKEKTTKDLMIDVIWTHILWHKVTARNSLGNALLDLKKIMAGQGATCSKCALQHLI
jgi:hypothetical protein